MHLRVLSVALFLASCLSALATEETCRVDRIGYSGWKAIQIANQWVKLTIVPQLGGRLMQVTFGNHDYLFVNEKLKGQYFSPEVSAAQKRWFNYGGDKIWPLPEGSSDEQHWSGAEGSVLDAGEFKAQVVSQGATCSVRLTGPTDAFIGQQYTREISIGAASPAISFRAVMKNTSGYPQQWSEQSVSQYNTADASNPAQPNTDIWGFAPVNPQSAYLNSFHVESGMASSSGYSVHGGLFAVHASEAGGEVWIDSPNEWVAVVDGATRFAMVERFRYVRGAEYPGKATVIFYTTETNRHGAPAPIHYMEAELNSPLVRLDPGESYTMETEWQPARMGAELVNVTYAGMIGRPLTATGVASGLRLSGEFGVFFSGEIQARFYDQRGLPIGNAKVQDVTPLEIVNLQQIVQAPADAARVSLHLIDRNGLDRGPLGETLISAPQP